MAYWHDLVTEKSWQRLQELRRQFAFVLIGGWAVYLYSRTLKSKDIDIVVDYDVLHRMRDAYPMTKNERLKKYEIPQGEFDVDIYVPHFSNPGIPAEAVLASAVDREGFRLPSAEALLLMKEHAHDQRRGTPKGEKDGYDLISLLHSNPIDWAAYHRLAQLHAPASPARLKAFLEGLREAAPLGLNSHQLNRLKRQWLPNL